MHNKIMSSPCAVIVVLDYVEELLFNPFLYICNAVASNLLFYATTLYGFVHAMAFLYLYAVFTHAHIHTQITICQSFQYILVIHVAYDKSCLYQDKGLSCIKKN